MAHFIFWNSKNWLFLSLHTHVTFLCKRHFRSFFIHFVQAYSLYTVRNKGKRFTAFFWMSNFMYLSHYVCLTNYTGVFRIKHSACWKRFVLSQSNIENYSEPINSPLPHPYLTQETISLASKMFYSKNTLVFNISLNWWFLDQ